MEAARPSGARRRTTGSTARSCSGCFRIPTACARRLWPARIAQRLGLDRSWLKAAACASCCRRGLRQLVGCCRRRASRSRPLPRVSAGHRQAAGRGWRCSPAASATRCSATPTGRPPACCNRTAATWSCREPGLLRRDSLSRRQRASRPAQFADANVRRLRRPASVDAVIVNVAGCGSMLKDYGHHWHDDGQAAREPRSPPRSATSTSSSTSWASCAPTGELPLTATYHDACHLAHAQKIREHRGELLAQIPGPRAARSARNRAVLRRGRHLQPHRARDGRPPEPPQARQHPAAPAPTSCVTANAGCLLQICPRSPPAGQRLSVVHPMDLLDLSYRGLKFKR